MTERKGPETQQHPKYASWVSAIMSVLGARGLAAMAAFLGNFLVARHLGPEGFGRFYMLFTIMTIVAGLTGPAIDTCLVRFAARHIQPGKDRSAPYFKFMLYVKCFIFAATMLIAVLSARPLLEMYLSDTPSGAIPEHAVVLAFLGGAIVSMWGFAQSYYQAHQRFSRYAGYEFLSSAMRLALVIILIANDNKNFTVYLLAYVAAPFSMALLSWGRLPRRLFTSRTSLKVGGELFHFGKWVFLAAIFTTIAQRLDLLLLNWSPFEIPKNIIGRYSLAVSVALAGELVLLTFYSVLLPKASQMKEASQLRHFIGNFRIPSLLFCLALSLVIPFSGFLVRVALGAEFLGTEVYFNIMLMGLIVALACSPGVTALYALGRSSIVAGFEAARLVLTLGIGLWVVPRHGVWGMALTIAGVRAVISVAGYFAAYALIRRMSEAEIAAREREAAARRHEKEED